MKIGCDLVAIERIEGKEAMFYKGILSEKEKALYETHRNKAEFLAGRFAAKEAFLKALGTGLTGQDLKKVEILYGPDGAPFLRFEGKEYSVSISHDGGYAFAVCLVDEL